MDLDALGKDENKLLLKAPLIWILLGISLLFLFGCSRHPVLSQKVPPARNLYNSASPADLSQYIRTVLKISLEDSENRQALEKLHEKRPALEELLRHISENPEDIQSRRTLAAHYLKEGLYYSAFELYEQIRSSGFEDAAAELGLARIWDEWGNYPLAKRHAERALELDPQSAKALELLGTIHLHRNDPQAAVSALLGALELTPENPSLHSTIGSVLLKLGNSGEAREYLEEAVALDPALIEARNDLAEALARLGDHDGALDEFAVANPPATAFNKLGLVYLADRKWEKAQSAFKQALVQDQNHVNAQLNLSVAQSHLPPPTFVHLPPLEAVDDTRTPRVADMDLDPASVDQEQQPVLALKPTLTVVGEQEETIDELLDDYKILPAGTVFERNFAPPTMVYLVPFEESTPTPYRPNLDPASIDQEGPRILALRPTLEDLPIGGLPIRLLLNPALDDSLDDHKILLAIAPRTALATPARISSLDSSPHLDLAAFFQNPTTARNGQAEAQVLLASVNPFGLGAFDIRDFIRRDAPWESLSLLGPTDSATYPFEVGFSAIGLGVLLFFVLGGPIGALIGALMRSRA